MKPKHTNQLSAPPAKQRTFSIPVQTMEKLDRIVEVTGISKENLALMLIRAKKRGMLDVPKDADVRVGG